MLRLTFVRIRKKKIMALLPLLILFVLFPAMSLFFSRQNEGGMEEALRIFTRQMHVWIPIFSIWWGLLLFHDFFMAGGNELLYLYHKSSYFIKIQSVAMLLYSFCIAASFFICRQFMPLEYFLLIQLIAEAFFAVALAYFLFFAFLNTGVGLLTVAAYCIYINFFDTLGLLDFMSVFPNDSFVTSENIHLIGFSCLSALVFLVLGFLCSIFRREYK